MRKYNRIMLGKAGVYADQCKQKGFIGADFGIEEDQMRRDMTRNSIKIQ